MGPPSVPAASEQTRLTCGLLPREPGVYRFRDARDRVIYVGRATDLRSRTLDQSLLLDRLAALLAGDPAAWDQTHTRLVLARDRAVARLAFETAAQIQDELTALGWSLAPQSVAGCSPADLRVHGWHDGLLLTLTAHVGFVDEWRTRPADESRAAPFVAETPHAWREFAARNARLAVRLRDSALHCRR